MAMDLNGFTQFLNIDTAGGAHTHTPTIACPSTLYPTSMQIFYGLSVSVEHAAAFEKRTFVTILINGALVHSINGCALPCHRMRGQVIENHRSTHLFGQKNIQVF